MRIAVTGGVGAVGEYVVRELASHGISHTIVDVRRPAYLPDGVDYVHCDLMHLESTVEVIRGYDVVIHLAAIPNAFFTPADQVMSVNMTTCYNVLEAIRRNGIPRIIYAGSESSTGFGIHDVVLKPRYLPVDEQHPLWPHESYSFTKYFGELMVENYARAFGIEGISLRYCGVWMRSNLQEVKSIIAPSLRGELPAAPWFGCYVSARDVAQAVRLSLAYRFSEGQALAFDAFFIMAASTFYPEPTLDVLRRIYGELPEVRDPALYAEQPFAPPFDIRKARQGLGYAPRFDYRDIDQWEEQV